MDFEHSCLNCGEPLVDGTGLEVCDKCVLTGQVPVEPRN